jgi:hypothetical protein
LIAAPLLTAATLSLALLLAPLPALAAPSRGSLPADRFVEWRQADIAFPDATWDTVEVSTLGIHPGNALADSIAQKLRNALAAKGSAKRVYRFAVGTYTFEQPLLIGASGLKADWNATGVDASNFVLLGAGPDATKFEFDCDVDYFKGLLWIEKPSGYSARNTTVALSTPPVAGATTITLPSTPTVAVGDFVSVKSDNDPDLMFPAADATSAWYLKYVAGGYDVEFAESYNQISRVSAISGNTLTLDPALALTYKSALNPRVSQFTTARTNGQIGFEGFSIEHIVPDSRWTAGGTNDIFNIVIRFAKNVFVKNVASHNAARGHVIVEYSHNVRVTGSKFGYARAYGVGGAGYGVCLQNGASQITVDNNEFDHLRHAVVLKEGANHSVIAYNWSHNWAVLDPAVTDSLGNPILAEADYSIHGMYSHSNLFEGNVGHNIAYADYWGPTGPRTTAYRNLMYGADTSDGIFIEDFSHRSNAIANVLPGQARLSDDGTNTDLYLEGNVLGTPGAAQWNTLTAAATLPPSLYLTSAPDFWDNTIPWPTYGPDVTGSTTNTLPVLDGQLPLDPATAISGGSNPGADSRSRRNALDPNPAPILGLLLTPYGIGLSAQELPVRAELLRTNGTVYSLGELQPGTFHLWPVGLSAGLWQLRVQRPGVQRLETVLIAH